MREIIRPVIGVTLSLWIVLGLGYPLAMTGLSQWLFPYQANGSAIRRQGVIVASAHVGQNFSQRLRYFWGRPSDTVSLISHKPDPYNAEASGASNLGPTNPALKGRIEARIRRLLSTTPGLLVQEIPISLVEGSGSGLDPDITVRSALIQIPRVAKATGLPPQLLRRLVQHEVFGLQWGIIGRRRINVVRLNLALRAVLSHQR